MPNILNKKRCYITFNVLLITFLILSIRIVNYKYFKSEDLATMVEKQYQYKEKAMELNYLLLDCNGKNLINYWQVYYAVIDPFTYLLNNRYAKDEDLEALKIILKSYDLNYDLDLELSKNKNSKIKWTVDEITYNKLKKLKGVNGFYTYKYSMINRENSWWNVENLITNTKRIENGELKPKADSSIEMEIANKTKNNEEVYNIFSKDVNGNIINEFTKTPENNINVRLTLDKSLQTIIKNVLSSAPYNKFEQVGVVLMESDTGKIKAMVQKDDSKPNVNIGASTQNGFFAGSIFKVLVEEAGIETNTISLNRLYEHKNYGGLFEEHEDKKTKSIKEAFIKSSNNIFVQVGEEVGIKNINALSVKHGLYDKILNFDEEQSGNLELNLKNTADDSGDSRQAYIGQKTRVTPIEAISIPNTVANKGVYVKPYIIEAYVDNNNNIIEEGTTKKSKIISETTANILKKQMIQVVSHKDGTGKSAYIPNIEVGGKTGTSKRIEIIASEDNRNINHKDYYDGWFAGFFKVKDKYYSMVVFVEDIGKDINASGTAVPIFKKIIEESYDYLNKL